MKKFLNEKTLKYMGAILPIILLVVDYLLKWKILSGIFYFVKYALEKFFQPVMIDLVTRPYLLLTLALVLVWLNLLHRRLKIVAGAFKENFKNGLVNWEFGGEGWTIERGDDGLELSVTNSPNGGITNFGLWDNFVFSFQCKIINKNVGWIIKAKDRVNYFMVQCSLNPTSEPTINPHFKLGDHWLVTKRTLNLKHPIKTNEWFGVKIIVYGNTVNVFINDERALHYFIPDPGRAIASQPITIKKGDKAVEKEKYIQENNVIFSFPNGKVGFRCSGDEHAHFRKIKVDPLSRL